MKVFCQWGDIKVVSIVSTLLLLGEETVSFWCGREVKTFKCPSALCAYNRFMGYVDLVDYDKKIGGGFTSRPHFKKWYKKGFLGILDFMMVNRRVAWNMSCEIPGIIRKKLNNRMWRVCVADLMLQWNDPHDASNDSTNIFEIVAEHKQQNLGNEWKGKRPRCIVCGFETSIRDGLKLTIEGCTDARCKKIWFVAANLDVML